MHDFKKHLETRLKRINEQRDGKKDAAKKKFKSMKAKWDENEKLVTCIVCPFTILINYVTQETRAEEISNNLSNLKKEEKSRARKIQEFERLVQTLQADLAKPIKVEDISEIDGEIVCFLFSNCTLINFETATPQSKPQQHA
jgi:hypothetical protein